MEIFWLTLYLTLPAFLGNAAPIIIHKLGLLKKLDYPIDCYKTFRGKRISGNNKTIRGFVIASLVGILVGLIQYFLHSYGIFVIPYFSNFYSFILFGFLAGFSALLGDALESFFKRQLGIQPGKPFLPFDQLDYLIGFLLITYFMVPWTFTQILFIFSFGLISPITNIVAYKLKIKNTYW